MRGLNPEWLKLSLRFCDNCGKRYRPKRPILGKHGFCTPDCKNQFFKSGGSYKRLEEVLEESTKGQLRELNARVAFLEKGIMKLTAMFLKLEEKKR